MQTQLIVNKNYRLELVEPDLIVLHIQGTIDYIKAVQLVDEQKRMADGRKAKLVISLNDMDFIYPEAQQFFTSAEVQKDIAAGAIVVPPSSILGRTIASTYLKLRKSEVPFKIVNDIDQAVNWLKSLHLK